jgi:hypothetical protein
MFWKKLNLKKKNNSDHIHFTILIGIVFKTVAQVSFKDQSGTLNIVRFIDSKWSKEILSYSEDPQDICFKFFAHSPNLLKEENLRLSIESKGETLLSQEFKISKDNEYTGWTELDGSIRSSIM